MKTIIVPTDFSENALNAAKYAACMASLRGDKLLLLHAYERPVAFSEHEVVTVHFDAVKEHIEKDLNQLKTTLLNEIDSSLSIETKIFNGQLIKNIKDLYEERETKLAVIGLTGASMANFFLGSNTLNIVHGVNRAILTVPPYASFKPVKKIVLTFDLWNMEETLPVARIKRISKFLKAEILILNIDIEQKGTTTELEADKQKLAELMAGISYSFHAIPGKKIVNDVKDFARQEEADLIAIVPREHGFLEGILRGNHTKALLFHSGIPILTLPPDE